MEREGISPSGGDWMERGIRPRDLLDWNLWGGWPKMFRGFGEPTVDMHETEDEVIVEVDVPGYDPKSLSARVAADSLTIRGTLDRKREEDKNGYYLRERQSGRFQRTIRFPTEVHADRAVAKYKDGVLRITAPKVMDTSNGARDVPIERE